MLKEVDLDKLRDEININPLEVYDKCKHIKSTLWDDLSKKDKFEILIIKIKNLWKLKYYEEGLECCKEAYSILETEEQLCEVYIVHAVVQQYIGNYMEAVELYFKALKIAQKMNDWKSIRRIYNNIGALYLIVKGYDEAYDYFLKVEELDKIYQEEVIEGITTLHGALAKIYANRGEYKQALSEIDKMIVYSRRNYHKVEEALAIGIKAKILKAVSRHGEALEFFNVAKEKLNELNIHSEDLNITMNKIECYYELGDKTMAIKLIEDLEDDISFDEVEHFVDYTSLLIKIESESIKDNSMKTAIERIINEHYKFQAKEKKYIIKSLNVLIDKIILQNLNEDLENENKNLKIENYKMKKINENLKLLCEIGKSIICIYEKEELIRVLYKHLKLLFNIDGIGILLIDYKNKEKADFIKYEKIYNINQDIDIKKTMSSFMLNNNLNWVLSNSIKNDFLDVLPNMKSVLIVPLMESKEINGSVILQKKCEDGFNEDILDKMKELAPFISIAINNIQKYERLNNKICKA